MWGNVAEFGAGSSPHIGGFCFIRANTHNPSWRVHLFKTLSNAACVRSAFRETGDYLSIRRAGCRSPKVKSINSVVCSASKDLDRQVCQFPWSVGGHHHLWDAVPQGSAEGGQGWMLSLPGTDFSRISALKIPWDFSSSSESECV